MAENARVHVGIQSKRPLSIFGQSSTVFDGVRVSGMLLVMGFAAINLWTAVLTQHTPAPPSPFGNFQDVFPGQGRNAVEAHGFACHWNLSSSGANETCSLPIMNDTLSEVQVGMSGDTITSTTFMLRDNVLRLGDFEAFLGEATLERNGRALNILWPDHHIMAIAFPSAKQTGLYMPLWSISLRGMGFA
jgi:hypothetical protein